MDKSLRTGEGWLLTACALILTLAAFSHWPYFCYVLLRLIVCASAAFAAARRHSEKRLFWVWVFGAVAVLFNPILPVRMARSDWRAINIAVAVFFICWALFIAIQRKGDGSTMR